MSGLTTNTKLLLFTAAHTAFVCCFILCLLFQGYWFALAAVFAVFAALCEVRIGELFIERLKKKRSLARK